MCPEDADRVASCRKRTERLKGPYGWMPQGQKGLVPARFTINDALLEGTSVESQGLLKSACHLSEEEFPYNCFWSKDLI